jgi:hypothetical protein
MRSILKTTAVLFALAAISTATKAQQGQIGATNSTSHAVLTDDSGNVVGFKEYSNLEGSPYFNADWAKGDVKFANSPEQRGRSIKYDEIKDALLTQMAENKIGEFDEPVIAFTITNSDGSIANFSQFPGNGKLSDQAYFQVLSDGKVKLLKKNAKAISEYKKDIGSAVTTREAVDNIDYYLLINGKAVRFKKDKKSVESALGNKQAELDTYIKANSLNLKNDDDLIRLIVQYNSL